MKPVRVNKYLMPALVVLLLLGTVWGAKAAGLWQTSGRGDILLDAEGNPDPAGIKGWMTLADLSETYGLPLDAVYVMVGAQPDLAPETAMKDLEKVIEGMEVSAVREGVAAYLAGAWTPEMGPFVTAQSVPAGDPQVPAAEPTQEPELTPAPQPELGGEPVPTEEHVPLGPGQGESRGEGVGTGSGFVLPEDGSRLAGAEIKGRMTLQEVIDYCQVPAEYLITELGLPEDVDMHLAMRDLAGQMGIEVQTVRDAVTRYQEEH